MLTFNIQKNSVFHIAFKLVLGIMVIFTFFTNTTHAQTIRFQNSLKGGLAVATNGFNLNSSTSFVNVAGGNRMSSSSDLVLPPNSQVVKAILYVEGYSGPINRVKFAYPGSNGLIQFDANSQGFIDNPTTGSYSQFIIDVTQYIPNNNSAYTSTVVAGGNGANGEYSCADPEPYDSGNYGYGWCMTVVYTNKNSTYRNVTIADQCVTYGIGSTSSILVPNIIVPAIGPVNAIVLTTGTWGDPGFLYRDNVTFGTAGNAARLTDPVSGADDDILNGTIGFATPNNVSDDGVTGFNTGNYVARNPYQGFGGTGGSAMYYDCDLMDGSGIIPPSGTPVTAEITQTGVGSDALGVGTYAVSVDIAAAELTKSISPTEIGVGDVATYTFTINNNLPSAIDLTNIGFEDNLPSGLEIANPNGVTITGGTGANVTAAPGTQFFSLDGLTLNAGQTCTITLDVTTNSGALNLSCDDNPEAFTNGFLNIQNNTENLANAVENVCLIVLGDPTADFTATEVCEGEATQFTDLSTPVGSSNITQWEWNFGDGNTSSASNPSHTYNDDGTYSVTLKVTDSNGGSDQISKDIIVKERPEITISEDVKICEGESTQLEATGGGVYSWTGGGLDNNSSARPIASPNTTTTYELLVTNSSTGCTAEDEVIVTVTPMPEAQINGNNEFCFEGSPMTLNGSGGENYLWKPGGNTTSSISISPKQDTSVRLIVSNNNCVDSLDFDIKAEERFYAGEGEEFTTCNTAGDINLFDYLTGYSNGGTWSIPGASAASLNSTTGNWNPENISPNTYQILYTIPEGDICPGEIAVVEATVVEAPIINVDSIVCEADNFNYTVHLSFSNGDINSYELNDAVNVAGQTTFKSDLISSGSNYEFWISDQYACQPVDSVSGIFSCGCATIAGTMNMDLDPKFCVDEQITAFHNGDETLVPGQDVLSFVMHDNAGTTIGTVVAHNSIPQFNFDPLTMSTETQYYISAVASLDDGNGLADLSNPNGCMKVSPGIPIVWNDLPEISVTPINEEACFGEEVAWEISLTKGMPSFEILDIEFLTVFNSENFTDEFKYNISQDSSISLNLITDANGCENTINPVISLESTLLNDVEIENLNISCNGTNTDFIVEFDVIKGDGNSYQVDGNSGSLDASFHFTSDEIPSGNSYHFDVFDDNNCNIEIVQGSHTCACGTVSGEMEDDSSTPPVEVCIENTFTANILDQNNDGQADGFQPDANDTQAFIILENMADTMSGNPPYLAESSTPTFSFNTSNMSTGVTYFVVPVAGDEDPSTGLIDWANGCKDYAEGTPFVWVTPSTVQISGPNEICVNTNLDIQVNVTSFDQTTFQLVGSNGYSQSHTFSNGTHTISIPIIDTGIFIFYVDTTNASISDNNGCNASWLGDTISVNVVSSAYAEFSLPQSATICEGESINLPLEISGSGTITVSLDNGDVFTNNAGTYPDAFNVTPTDSTLYQITNITAVSNNGTSCPGSFSSDPFAVNVNAINADPQLVPNEICEGDISNLLVNSDGDNPEYTIYFSDGTNNYIETSSSGNFTGIDLSPESTTVYRIDSILDNTISDASGLACTYYGSSLTLNVNPLPTAEISNTGETEICEGENAEYTINFSGEAPFTFVLYDQAQDSTYDAVSTSQNPFIVNYTPIDTNNIIISSLIDNNGCIANELNGIHILNVNATPKPSFIADKKDSCLPLSVELINTTSAEFFGTVVWNFGDGNTSTQIASTNHIFTEVGNFNVSLTVNSDNGCTGTFVDSNYIVHPIPVAQFSYQPQQPSVLANQVLFVNESTETQSANWELDDFGFSNELSPFVEMPSDTAGSYTIKLRVTSEFGCTDSTSQIVVVEDRPSVYFPNAFSPNGDDVNEVYLPTLRGVDVQNYYLKIFNRWGELVFETEDPNEGWDGIYNLKNAPTGLYQAVARYRLPNSSKKVFVNQQVNLLR